MKLVSLDAFDPEITFDINFKTYTFIYYKIMCIYFINVGTSYSMVSILK